MIVHSHRDLLSRSSRLHAFAGRTGFIVVVFGCFLTCGDVLGQRTGTRKTAAPAPSAAPTQNSDIPQQDFAMLSAQATAAREADRVDEAITLYQKALTE